MNINLLAASATGLFIGMLIIMIVVVLLTAFLTYMIFRQMKKPPENADVFNVKKMLSRRITQLTIEVMNNNDDEVKKTELVNKLRRTKSAEALVDELIAEEKAISGITGPDEKTNKHRPNGNGQQRPVRRPVSGQPAVNNSGEQPSEGEQPKPAEQPVVKSSVKPAKKKKKDKLEFEPSED